MPDVILFFNKNTDVMVAIKALREAGVTARMIPKPPAITSSTNLCLSIDIEFKTYAQAALSSAGVELGGTST